MTGAIWRSAFVAAVFAIHPLRMESVAWIAERKDVLSGLFFMLTIGTYVRYVRHPWSLGRYLMVVLTLALALMSKPMVVTLPFVLLLLDYWPLKRFIPSGGNFFSWRLIIEKIPLLVLSGIVCVVTFFAQKQSISSPPFLERMGNALASYVIYLEQMFYPVGLAVFYPYSKIGWVKIVPAFILLLLISASAVAARRRQPWFLFGWLWYLGMLVPVSGILQAGSQAHADRYTYLSQIGLYIALTWGVADLWAGWRYRRFMLGGISTVILVVLICCARTQVSYWRNSESLWTHALACTADNIVAENNLGNAFYAEGNVDEAMVHYRKALQINPDHAEANYNLANALMRKGEVDEAITHFQQALEVKSDDAKIHYHLGIAFIQKGRLGEAVTQFQQSLQINPDDEVVRNNLGNTLFQNGEIDEAIAEFQNVLQIKPDYVEAHYNLGYALFLKGNVDEAIIQFQAVLQIKHQSAEAHYYLGNAFLQKGKLDDAAAHFQAALKIRPDYADAQNNLAWLLATSPQASLRNGKRAVELARRANQISGGKDSDIIGTLAAAYAETGQFAEAIASVRKAIELTPAAGGQDQLAQLNNQLKLYQARLPFHQQGQ